MILGMEIGLSPVDFVLDEEPAPSPKTGRSPSPIFGPFLSWSNSQMHQDATWYGDRPQPRGLCVRWGPSLPLNFSVHVYYSYCGFVRTLHYRYWLVQVPLFYAFYFQKKCLILLKSVPIFINTEANSYSAGGSLITELPYNVVNLVMRRKEVNVQMNNFDG